MQTKRKRTRGGGSGDARRGARHARPRGKRLRETDGRVHQVPAVPLDQPSGIPLPALRNDGGEVVLGTKKVTITGKTVLQGGVTEPGEDEFGKMFAAKNGITLSKTPQTVPGGLLGIVPPESSPPLVKLLSAFFFENALTGVNSTLELAKTGKRHPGLGEPPRRRSRRGAGNAGEAAPGKSLPGQKLLRRLLHLADPLQTHRRLHQPAAAQQTDPRQRRRTGTARRRLGPSPQQTPNSSTTHGLRQRRVAAEGFSPSSSIRSSTARSGCLQPPGKTPRS